MNKIGAYKVGNGYTRFKTSNNVEKLLKIADSTIGFDEFKRISKSDAVNLFSQFNNKCGRLALEQLPQNPKEITYFAGHNSIQIIADDKNVLSMIKRMRNPITEMIKSIPKRILVGLKKIK